MAEKEADKDYSFRFKDYEFEILRNNKVLRTSNRKIVKTDIEKLAERTVCHLNKFGEDYAIAYSIFTFLYSKIDFFDSLS